MRFFNIKLLLLIALFVALVAKGGQLCSAVGVQAMTRLVEKDRVPTVEPLPLRPIEEEFRGVSPVPDLADRALSGKRTLQIPQKLAALKKSAKNQASSKDASKKSAKKN